jgi:hypothetical protein
VPRAVDLGLDVVLLGDRVADLGARRARQRPAVGIGEDAAALVDRPAVAVDPAAEVVDRVAVAGAQRPATPVDPRQAGRVRARAVV